MKLKSSQKLIKNVMALSILSLSITTLLMPTTVKAAEKATKVNAKVNTTEIKESKAVVDADGYIDFKSDTVRYNRISSLAEEKLKTKPERILEIPSVGLYELFLPQGKILYFTKDEKFLIDGALVNLNNMKENITNERTLKSLPYNRKELNLNDAIKTVYGNGSRELITFEDPNCGYCKKFYQEKQKIENVTIYTFIAPVLGPDSLSKSKDIWCSADKVKAWDTVMTKGTTEKSATCDTSAIDRNLEVMKKFKISGTPTIFFANGKRVPGATPLENIEKNFSQVK